MRQNKSGQILDYFIRNTDHSVSLKELEKEFGISVRQIKNYITSMNKKCAPDILFLQNESGGYYLCKNYRDYIRLFAEEDYSPRNRAAIILSELLSAEEGTDIFDLADMLYVSRPTVEADLNKIRKIISEFQLTLSVHDNLILLKGSEKNKRKLTSSLITNSKYNGFRIANNRYLREDYQVENIVDELKRIFEERHFIYNDYSINNIVLHIVITIDRLRNHNELMEVLPSTLATELEIQVADDVIAYLEDHFDVTFSRMERQNLILFLSCNLATVDYHFADSQNRTFYISERCEKLVNRILGEVENYYYLEGFDNVFISRFSFHINNLLQRIDNHFSVKNPLKEEIRNSYPLIYDIAVFIAKILFEETGKMIDEDEISLIALHIGGFLETVQKNKNKLSAIYVYIDYHGFYKYNIEKIQKKFENILNISYSISSGDYTKTPLDADLILTEIFLGTEHEIQISPFVKKEELDVIEEKAAGALQKKRRNQFLSSFQKLFHRDIFFTNIQGKDKYDTIELLLKQFYDLDYYYPSFVEEVLERERMSSTCFHNGIAIPHAISQDVKRSFIAICCYEKKIRWDNDNVAIAIIIGISYAERKIFREVFNQLMSLLSLEKNVLAISRCKNYEEVIRFLAGEE